MKELKICLNYVNSFKAQSEFKVSFKITCGQLRSIQTYTSTNIWNALPLSLLPNIIMLTLPNCYFMWISLCVQSLTLTLSGPVRARWITEQRSYKPEIPEFSGFKLVYRTSRHSTQTRLRDTCRVSVQSSLKHSLNIYIWLLT